MRVSLCICALIALSLPGVARADCAADIDKALVQARALPQSAGKNAVLEDIERARISRHEGDEDDCKEQIGGVLDLLKTSGKPPKPPIK